MVDTGRSDQYSNSQASEYGDVTDEITPLVDISYLLNGALLTPLEPNAEPPKPTQVSAEDECEIKLKKRKSSDVSDTSTLVDEPPAKRKKTETGKENISTNSYVDVKEPYIIASSQEIEVWMRQSEIPVGVSLELARLLSSKKITYEDIGRDKITALVGSNAQAAPRTARLFQPNNTLLNNKPDPAFAQENAATSPWEEMDKEQKALSRNPYAGLGHSQDDSDWYGGKINFTGKLKSTKQAGKDGLSYEIVLDRCCLGPSSRFARRFGSTSILRVKVDGEHLFRKNRELLAFFKRPLILWGRVYRSFFAKDSSIFMFKTNEGFTGGKIVSDVFPGFSFLDLLHWHNPLSTNRKQGMPKWAARMALGLSNTVPGPLLELDNILNTPDVLGSDKDAPGSDMTDGCGYSNRATHLQIYHMLKPDSYPIAFQYRLAGVKGMSSERSDLPFNDNQKIWVRPSQTKITYPADHHDPSDLTLRIIELVRTSQMRSPARLSAELIINLAENGVPSDVFRGLLKTQISDIVTSLTTWQGENAMYNLWVCIERIGAVLFARRSREAAGEARARGYGESPDDDDDGEEDEDEDSIVLQNSLGQRSTAWWPDYVSGCPSSLEETVLVLLDAGFSPASSPILREKLRQITKSRIRNSTQKVNWDVPQSAIAFVVPDEYGVLGEDEVQIKSSSRNLLLNGEGNLRTDIILGEVLLTRNPCKLPTDVRKVKAVQHPELQHCVDVIVCSVKGRRRLLDFLAGGDYDGDRATAIWATEFVNNFTNAEDKHSVESPGVMTCFTSETNVKVAEFERRISTSSAEDAISEYQTYLLGALRDPSIIGKCAKMHEVAVYIDGYASPSTTKLAHIFCKVLDGGKSGLVLKHESFQTYWKKYSTTRGPRWKERFDSKKKKHEQAFDTGNLGWLTKANRKPGLKGFVMDKLVKAAKEEEECGLKGVDTVFADLKGDKISDPDLRKPWEVAVAMAELGSDELKKAKRRDLSQIAIHVREMRKKHKDKVGKKFTDNAIETRQDTLRSLSREFAERPKLEDMETIVDEATITRLRASYAYIYDGESESSGWSRFPWNLALRDLCHIKAAALGPHKTTTIGFYEHFKLSLRR